MFCPQCGVEVGETQVFCHACGGRIVTSFSSEEMRGKTAWELRSERGFLDSLLQTMRESLFGPTSFFKKMTVFGGLTDPTLYAMITGMAGITMLSLWQMLFHEVMPMSVPEGIEAAGGEGAALAALCAPLLIVAGLHCWSGMLHALLLLMGGAKYGYEATFRVSAYSYGATVFLAVPFFGWPIAVVWCMVLAITGLKNAQGAGGGKAAFAVLFPILFCCAATVVVILLVFGAIAASFGAMTSYPWK